MNFQEIWRRNLWGGAETRSGPGSSIAATRELAEWLVGFVRDNEIAGLLDAPCGECRWMPLLPCAYLGVDLVPGAVRAARRRQPELQFQRLDLLRSPLPAADAVFSRDFMQHLSVAEGLTFVGKARETGARWLIASTYPGGDNRDPESNWHAYRVNLEAAPFGLGPPVASIFDGYDEDGHSFRDPRKAMGAWRL